MTLWVALANTFETREDGFREAHCAIKWEKGWNQISGGSFWGKRKWFPEIPAEHTGRITSVWCIKGDGRLCSNKKQISTKSSVPDHRLKENLVYCFILSYFMDVTSVGSVWTHSWWCSYRDVCYWGGGPADLNTCHYHSGYTVSWACHITVCTPGSFTQQMVTVMSCSLSTGLLSQVEMDFTGGLTKRWAPPAETQTEEDIVIEAYFTVSC